MTDPAALLEEAADWADRLDTLSPEAREELREWLNRSPAHRDALSRMVRLLGDPALVCSGRASGTAPCGRSATASIASLDACDRRADRRRIAVGLAAALAAGVATPFVWHLATTGEPSVERVYASTTGQQRQVALPDGSAMTLDAASRVAIAFSGHARDLTLQSGAARFEVRHDTTRPFAVSTPEGQMVALGTNFSVDRGAGHSELRVYRGRVRLTVPGQPAAVVRRALGGGGCGTHLRPCLRYRFLSGMAGPLAERRFHSPW